MPSSPTQPPRDHGRPPGTDYLELSWEFFGELCRVLALKVSRGGYDPDLIIGVAKAGVIPGAVVASILRRDFYSMKISRGMAEDRVRARPKIFSEAPRDAAGKRVLIVDEICTSGETLRITTNALRQVGPAEIRTATSLVRQAGHHPDFWALETDSIVIFPWDRQVVNEEGEIVVNPMYQEALG